MPGMEQTHTIDREKQELGGIGVEVDELEVGELVASTVVAGFAVEAIDAEEWVGALGDTE